MTSSTGILRRVDAVELGTRLTADALTGDMTLTVEDPVFNAGGGEIALDDQVLRYTASTEVEDGATLDLEVPLIVDVEAGYPVRVAENGAVVVNYWGQVDLDDPDAGTVTVVVPPHIALQVSAFDDLVIPVRMEPVKGSLQVVQLLDQVPQVASEDYVPGGATEPPATSPLPKVYGGHGALVVAWVSEEDVTVDVHVSTSTPVDTAGSPAASVTGSGVGLQWVRALADGTPVTPAETYYVALVARNEAGSAPASDEASGSPAFVEESDINVTANMLIANLALIEALAATTVHVTGEATLRSLTALGKVAFRDPANELGQGSWLYMRGGTTSPVTSATVTQDWDSTAYPFVPDYTRTWRFGGTWHGGTFYLGVDVFGGVSGVHTWNTDGSTTVIHDLAGDFAIRGLTRLGSNWYVLGRDFSAGWRIRVFNDSWVQLDEWQVFPASIPYDPAIGNDGTNLMLARAWNSGNVHVQTLNPTTGVTLTDTTTPINTTSHLSSVQRGTFDYGSTRTIVSTRDRSGGDKVYALNSSNVRVSSDEWGLADGRVAALVWDGTNFRHLSREAEKVWIYAADMVTTTRWVSAAWASGSDETTQGPAADYTPIKRRRAAFKFPDLPSGATGVSVYVGQGATEPGRAGMWRQVANHPDATYTMPGAPTLSGVNPLEVSTYPGGSPSGIRSDTGAYYFDSTGALHCRTLIVDEP